MVRGLVVDSDGAPVVGMFVYTGTRTGSSFIPHSTPSAVTNDQGRYAVPCSTEVASTVTKVLPSASIEGHVKTDRGCADSDFSLWLWLNGNRPTAVQLGNLNEGDAFTISGLPEGSHVLAAVGRHIPVTLKAGGHVTQDVTFACPDEPTGTPTVTPPPVLPTPSDTTTPDPSDSPTPTGTGGAGGG